MISDVVSHCGLGNTNGNAVRGVLRMGLEGKVRWVDSRAHLPVRHARKALGVTSPAIGQVRNPFDWYVATWYTEMQYHRWRGGFQDWFYHRKSIPYQSLREDKFEGMWMWDWFLYFSEVEPGQGPAYDYIMQTERLLQDLVIVLEDIEIIPRMIDREWVIEKFPYFSSLNVRRQWFEGVEQWMRGELYTTEMIDKIYEQDAPIFERFGYTFEQRYYYQGGCGQSCHGTQIGNFEEEKSLSACWAEWGREPPGPFAKP